MNILKGIRTSQITVPSINTGPKLVSRKGIIWYAGRFLLAAVFISVTVHATIIAQTDLMQSLMFFAGITCMACIISAFTVKEKDTKVVSVFLAIVFLIGYLFFSAG